MESNKPDTMRSRLQRARMAHPGEGGGYSVPSMPSTRNVLAPGPDERVEEVGMGMGVASSERESEEGTAVAARNRVALRPVQGREEVGQLL